MRGDNNCHCNVTQTSMSISSSEKSRRLVVVVVIFSNDQGCAKNQFAPSSTTTDRHRNVEEQQVVKLMFLFRHTNTEANSRANNNERTVWPLIWLASFLFHSAGRSVSLFSEELAATWLASEKIPIASRMGSPKCRSTATLRRRQVD